VPQNAALLLINQHNPNLLLVETVDQRQKVKKAVGFNSLSTALIGKIGDQLSDPSAFIRASHLTRQAIQTQHWQRLTCNAQPIIK
jgi:hypothetical protein